MTASILAVELAYWQQSILRVLGVLAAVLLPAGTVRHTSSCSRWSRGCSPGSGPWRPGRTARCSCSPRSASSSRRRTSSPSGPTGGCSRRRRTSWWAPCCSSTARCRSAPMRSSPTSTPASSTCSPCRRSRPSACCIAGWSSANKYSLMGGLRAAGQLIAYELPMVLAVIGVVIQAGTHEHVGHRRRPGRRRDLRLGRAGQPVLHHPVRGDDHLPHRGAGRAGARPRSTCPSPSPSSSPAT